jgi:hypothetical protein
MRRGSGVSTSSSAAWAADASSETARPRYEAFIVPAYELVQMESGGFYG